MIDLSVVVLSWNTVSLLADCLRSIPDGARDVAYEVIVVDNASTDGSADRVARDFPQVQLIRNTTNVGFTRANNQGLATSRGR
jgi:GT2 family glycosyltransferase